MQDYVEALSIDGLAPPPDPGREVPYDSVMDYVQTLQNTCAPQGAFKWPATAQHDALNYSRALSAALTHLPPGRV
eukprot:9222304-Lingulodinium_polyedra.AAC.1